ncbi:MAG TPA: regulatory protein RecX [Chloroflexi bacterium]|nr:regulatory protein RecX [Chloroflexota bacterium]
MGGQITEIKVQRGNQKRVNVYLDGEYGFSLGILAAASLGRGDQLSDEAIEELERQDAAHTAYDRSLNFLGYRPRSVSEVRRYLADKGFAPEVVERVIDRLTEASLLDDLAFARYWVENRETFRPRGALLLRQELREKGIAESSIEEVLAEVDEDRSAYRAASQRAVRYARLDDEAFQEKMFGFLRRRGFGYEVTVETVSRLLLQRGGDERAEHGSSGFEERWKGA